MCVGPFAPKVPDMPPPPPPMALPEPVSPSDNSTAKAITASRTKERQQAALALGRQSTIKTGAQGLNGTSDGLKTAFGV